MARNRIHEFGVRSKYYDTYKRFKKDAGKFGIRYVRTFTPFRFSNAQYVSCLWFGKGFDDCNYKGVGMALSNPENSSSKIIDLDTDYYEALQYVKEWYAIHGPKKRVRK